LLSYRHGFHAGNFADLLKHFTQVEILKYLTKKDKPFDYIDTHAGAGMYRLDSGMASKNAEFETGIGHFWDHRNTAPDELQDYLATVKQCNPSKSLTHYPGSPGIAEQFLRPFDKAWLYDLHTTDFNTLQQHFEKQRNVKARQEDGFQALLGLLPTQSRRALVLMDPPFEQKDDYRRIPETVKKAHKRMPTTVFAIWYPVVDRRRINDLHRNFKNSGIKNICVFELGIEADQYGHGMNASGMIVINPPWTLFSTMQATLPKLAKIVSKDSELHFRCEQLVGE
jgi:23S rRNA (adenine2030-N6)-methyltransferase